MTNHKILYHCVTIFDSYKVRKCNMSNELKAIEAETKPGDTIVFNRSKFSLKMEWICHNFLYGIHYKREQTKDVDLDYPCDHPEWMYCICGILVWPFTFKTK